MNDEQRRVAPFQGQPDGLGLFSRPAALSFAHIEQLHFAHSALLDRKTAPAEPIGLVLTGPSTMPNSQDSFRSRQALKPRAYIFVNTLVTAVSLYLFSRWGVTETWFFMPVVALAVCYAVLYFVRQCRGDSPFSIISHIHFPQLIQRALVRYVIWLIALGCGYVFYQQAPLYSAPEHYATQSFFAQFFMAYLWLGLPYFLLTLIFKSSRVEDFYDPAIRILHVVKQITLRTLRDEDSRSIWRVLRRPYNRKVFLNLVMRAYFIPVMVEQVAPTAVASLNTLYREFSAHDLLTLLFAISTTLWLIDVLNACVAYCLESRWLENRSRSIDLTVGGWLVCFSCYEPINQITGTLFPFAPTVATNQVSDLIIVNMSFFYALKILETFLTGVHIYADTSLGTSGANITLKKLQTQGLYGLIRHPGTTTKLTLWLVQSFFYRRFWSIKFIFGYSMWAMLYVLRALTEERHLSKFSEYRAYMKKVKYRFFPGLF
jgi:protein-S-isoprenylcysteine O-methyltransferase Ste14